MYDDIYAYAVCIYSQMRTWMQEQPEAAEAPAMEAPVAPLGAGARRGARNRRPDSRSKNLEIRMYVYITRIGGFVVVAQAGLAKSSLCVP